MPNLPFPISGVDPEKKLKQMELLLAQMFEERIGGANLGDVFTIDSDDILTLGLSSTAGLQKTSNQLEIKNKATGGLTKDAAGEQIKLKALGGLTTDADGLYITSGFDGFGSPTELTISTGAVSVAGTVKFRHYTIDTEGDAASDDLDTISGGNAGELLLVSANNTDRTVVLKNSATLNLGGDYSLDDTGDKALLVCISSGVWHGINVAVTDFIRTLLDDANAATARATLAAAASGANSDITSLNGPALGTPSAGDLANCTGLPAAGVVGTAAVVANTLKGDGTAGRVLRKIYIEIGNGTNANTIKVASVSRWNGNVNATEDNLGKSGDTGVFTLNAAGTALTLQAAGLTGNCVAVIAETIIYNASGTAISVEGFRSGNDIVLNFYNAITAAAYDLTVAVDTGMIFVDVTYLTSA